LEDSQLETAERLIKLTAIAARAACTIMQLVQARDGQSAQRNHPVSHAGGWLVAMMGFIGAASSGGDWGLGGTWLPVPG
jgi:hypothetical protein